MHKNHIIVGMSGGVDSSVAAALLINQGYDVRGIMLKLWNDPNIDCENRCCTPTAMATAKKVASILGIPLYVLDAKEIFYSHVVRNFLDGYSSGITPNPCIICNHVIRWGTLFEYALRTGANYFATGHYARITTNKNGQFQLRKASDTQKDQSYFLHKLEQKHLKQTIFPLDGHTKQTTREIARTFNLPVADNKDSQDLCFLGAGTLSNFLQRNVINLNNPGTIQTIDGRIIGRHRGLAYYTIGQREGLGISGSTPFYVIEKQISTNTLIVGKHEHRFSSSFRIANINWISGSSIPDNTSITIKIRSQMNEVPAKIGTVVRQGATIILDTPIKDITPGQSAVFYQDDICLGGGIIIKDTIL